MNVDDDALSRAWVISGIKQDIIDDIEIKTTGHKHFKIGKSGEAAPITKARYVPDEYDEWGIVYSSQDKKLIDDLEAVLIDHFRTHRPEECDNDQTGGGPPDTATYIYLAFRT